MAKRKGRDDSELKAKFIKFASTMRLSSYEIASIVELVKKNFADDATVYLFGSRVNVFYNSIQRTKQLLKP